MFTKKVQIEISEDAKVALGSLDNDILALAEMMGELVATHQKVLAIVRGEVAVLVADAAGAPIDGLKVFEDETDKEPPTIVEAGPAEPPKKRGRPRKGSLAKPPDAMAMEAEFTKTVPDADRVRSSPFTRAPRGTQVAWLREVMADGEWYAPVTIGREYANDERHYRYLRAALSGRLREMHEDGLVERRDSRTKGAMYEYRLRKEG